MRLALAAGVLALGVLLLGSPRPAHALEELRLQGGTMFVAHVPDAAPGPPSKLVETFGAGLTLWSTELGPLRLQWRTDLLAYGSPYDWSVSELRPVPVERERADRLWVLGGLVDTSVALGVALGDKLHLGLAGGVAVHGRLPLIVDAGAGASEAADSTGYFFSAARFLLPYNALLIGWDASPRLGVELAMRAYYPLFHLWDGEGRPFADQLMLAAVLGVRLPLQ